MFIANNINGMSKENLLKVVDPKTAADAENILGLSNRDYGSNELTMSYRTLSGAYHPDRYTEDKEKKEADIIIKKINEAYDILKKRLGNEKDREYIQKKIENKEFMIGIKNSSSSPAEIKFSGISIRLAPQSSFYIPTKGDKLKKIELHTYGQVYSQMNKIIGAYELYGDKGRQKMLDYLEKNIEDTSGAMPGLLITFQGGGMFNPTGWSVQDPVGYPNIKRSAQFKLAGPGGLIPQDIADLYFEQTGNQNIKYNELMRNIISKRAGKNVTDLLEKDIQDQCRYILLIPHDVPDKVNREQRTENVVKIILQDIALLASNENEATFYANFYTTVFENLYPKKDIGTFFGKAFANLTYTEYKPYKDVKDTGDKTF